MYERAIKAAVHELVLERRKQIPFWILVGFLPTYLIARWLVHSDPDLFLRVHGLHVHHFIYGFFVLAFVGFVSLETRRGRRVQAFIYGVGLALAFDEFGMWVRLADNYSIRASQDAMAIIAGLLVFAVYGYGILRRAWYRLRD
jgi:hypothetical protein